MARINIKKIKERAQMIDAAWEEGAPAVEFNGLTKSDYDADNNAAQTAEDELADLKAQIKIKEDEVNDKYKKVGENSVKVGKGVAGHKDYGDDSPLYGAMGFVRKSERKSGLTRRKNEPATT